MMLYIFLIKRNSLKSVIVFTFILPLCGIASPVLGIASLFKPSISPFYVLMNIFSVINWIGSIISLEDIGHTMPNFIFGNIVCKLIAVCFSSFYMAHLAYPTREQKFQAFQRTKVRLDSVSRGSIFETYASSALSAQDQKDN